MKKGTKLSVESKKAISTALRRRTELRRALLELIIRGSRVYVRSLGNNAVSVEVDVTPVWHFFKGAIKYSYAKASGRTPNINDPDYDDL